MHQESFYAESTDPSVYLSLIVNSHTPYFTCMKRVLSFYQRSYVSPNEVIRTCLHISASGFSVFDVNLRLAISKLSIDYYMLNVRANNGTLLNEIGLLQPHLSDETLCIAFTISELCCCRRGSLSCIFDSNEVDSLLSFLCMS